MPELVKYEAAVKALALCTSIDEVKTKYRDKAVAMEHYAKLAKDGRLIADAVRVRLMAERRAGAMLIEMAESGTRHRGKTARGVRVGTPMRAAQLRDIGIDKRQSSDWQKLAALREIEFNRKVKRRVEIAVASVEGNREVIRMAREERQAEKKKRRDQRERALAVKIKDLPEKRYGVILADPGWSFDTWSKETGMDRSAANHYTTQTVDDIKSLKVDRIAADDSVLFLWATVPMLPQALMVMKAWGFEYKTHLAWITKQPGTGYWFRNAHELLLVGTKGDVPAPAMGEQFQSWVMAEPTVHSAKPAIIHQMIESYFPSLPKVELNARAKRDGWDTWGNEAPEEKKPEEVVKTGGPLDELFAKTEADLSNEIAKTYGDQIKEGEILPPLKNETLEPPPPPTSKLIYVGAPVNRDVLVSFEKGEQGLWFGTSEEFRGLLTASKTLDEAISDAPVTIAQLASAQSALGQNQDAA